MIRSNCEWLFFLIHTYVSGSDRIGYLISRLGCKILVVEASRLHNFKQFGVRVWLKLVKDECVADDMLLKPLLLQAYHLINMGLICKLLVFLLLEVANVVPEEVVTNHESLHAFETLLSCIGDAV